MNGNAMWLSIMALLVIGLAAGNYTKYNRQKNELRRMQYLDDAMKEIEKREQMPTPVIKAPYIDL